jgi:hypothetical protein
VNLHGTWTGVYAYDPDAMWDEVSFVIHIRSDGGRAFKGDVQDGAGGHPMPGQIVGKFIESGAIEFVKTMPSTLRRFPDGSLDVFGKRVQKIFYRGRPDGPNSFSGEWTVRGGWMWFRGKLYIARKGKGTWRMSRQT